MTSPTNKVNPYEDVTLRSKELDKKERKAPMRKFDEDQLIEQIDDRRRMKEEEELPEDEKKRPQKTDAAAAAKTSPWDKDSKPLSLFDLARTDAKHSKEKNVAFESKEHPEEDLLEAPLMTKPPKEEKDVESPLYAGQTALPAHAPVTAFEGKVATESKFAPSKSLQEIIDQIVNKVYTVKESDGQSEIVVELKGRFEGARLIVKDFNFAKKEMNITIDHLKTGEDQNFLLSHKQELIDKLGKEHQIVVHIFTATTGDELPRFDFKAQEKDFRREPQQEKEREQPEKDNENEEN